MPYFERLDAATFRATPLTGGAWKVDEQHIAPALGLLTHVIETDRDARRDDGLQITRVTFDIWGTVPIAEVATEVRVVRPGRTIELVEASLSHAGRVVVSARAWLMSTSDITALAGSALDPLPAPDDLEPWDPTQVWPGGFIGTVELRRDQVEPGRGRFWARTEEPLLAEPISPVARVLGLVDIANGMTVRADPRAVAFPNLDLTAHLLRAPVTGPGGWVGFDTTVSFGPTGHGLTSTVLHDAAGPLGTVAQTLTVRPT